MQPYITEAMAKQRADELVVHVYEFAVEDQTKKVDGSSMYN